MRFCRVQSSEPCGGIPLSTDLRHVICAVVNDVFGIARDGLTPGEWDGQLRRAAPPVCGDVVMFNNALQKVMDRCCDEPVSLALARAYLGPRCHEGIGCRMKTARRACLPAAMRTAAKC